MVRMDSVSRHTVSMQLDDERTRGRRTFFNFAHYDNMEITAQKVKVNSIVTFKREQGKYLKNVTCSVIETE